MRSRAFVLIGGVDVSAACLEQMCRIGLPPALVIGYTEAKSASSGYVDMSRHALAHGVRCILKDDVNSEEVLAAIAEMRPVAGFVIGWSALLGEAILKLPKYGWFGIHPTLLPTGRGRAPIPWTILKGLDSTASTMFQISSGIDDGPIVGTAQFAVSDDDDANSLYAKHRDAHMQLVESHVLDVLENTVSLQAQDDSKATYWKRRTPEDGRIDWSCSMEEICQLVRAVTRPFPGAFFDHGHTRITVWKAVRTEITNLAPGQMISATGPRRMYVGCGLGALELIDYDCAVVDI